MECATLGQLLIKHVPDADVHFPDVIVVGSQSSGKTMMVLSMVFRHLIGNPLFTDHMGDKLLPIFLTGEKMVTRRPTRIQLTKAPEGSDVIITLQLGQKPKANYNDPTFDAIIQDVRTNTSRK
jgi:hypothetical protein